MEKPATVIDSLHRDIQIVSVSTKTIRINSGKRWGHSTISSADIQLMQLQPERVNIFAGSLARNQNQA